MLQCKLDEDVALIGSIEPVLTYASCKYLTEPITAESERGKGGGGEGEREREGRGEREGGRERGGGGGGWVDPCRVHTWNEGKLAILRSEGEPGGVEAYVWEHCEQAVCKASLVADDLPRVLMECQKGWRWC